MTTNNLLRLSLVEFSGTSLDGCNDGNFSENDTTKVLPSDNESDIEEHNWYHMTSSAFEAIFAQASTIDGLRMRNPYLIRYRYDSFADLWIQENADHDVLKGWHASDSLWAFIDVAIFTHRRFILSAIIHGDLPRRQRTSGARYKSLRRGLARSAEKAFRKDISQAIIYGIYPISQVDGLAPTFEKMQQIVDGMKEDPNESNFANEVDKTCPQSEGIGSVTNDSGVQVYLSNTPESLPSRDRIKSLQDFAAALQSRLNKAAAQRPFNPDSRMPAPLVSFCFTTHAKRRKGERRRHKHSNWLMNLVDATSQTVRQDVHHGVLSRMVFSISGRDVTGDRCFSSQRIGRLYHDVVFVVLVTAS
jgi:hypothetical protein